MLLKHRWKSKLKTNSSAKLLIESSSGVWDSGISTHKTMQKTVIILISNTFEAVLPQADYPSDWLPFLHVRGHLSLSPTISHSVMECNSFLIPRWSTFNVVEKCCIFRSTPEPPFHLLVFSFRVACGINI